MKLAGMIRFRTSFFGKVILQVAVSNDYYITKESDIRWRDAMPEDVVALTQMGMFNPNWQGAK